jgi:muramidase (phage lysozyme)
MSNRQALLDTIAMSEGTERIGKERGYNVLVGGGIFASYADHPRILVTIKNAKGLPVMGQDGKPLRSTAAGRYQILARYFDTYKLMLKLPDFSPDSQDAIALQMIKEQGALADIDAGHFVLAISKIRNIWASLPGAGYGQHENAIESLSAAYVAAGGTLS